MLTHTNDAEKKKSSDKNDFIKSGVLLLQRDFLALSYVHLSFTKSIYSEVFPLPLVRFHSALFIT